MPILATLIEKGKETLADGFRGAAIVKQLFTGEEALGLRGIADKIDGTIDGIEPDLLIRWKEAVLSLAGPTDFSRQAVEHTLAKEVDSNRKNGMARHEAQQAAIKKLTRHI